MLLRRFYDDNLAQASYLLGCQATGEALVIDANRDVEQYLAAAEQEGMRISHVTETHIHADYVSGSRELARRARAQLLLSREGGRDWQYAFAKADGAKLVGQGDALMVGNLRVQVMHTPGHTPEHLCFMVTDTPATDKPMGVFTGDFIFVGDVGRPDLLERAAKVENTMEAGARELYRSIQRFKQLPDYLQLWPGHGAGSACGKALGAVPSTTLGYERIANWGLAPVSEREFVAMVLAGQPEPPRYFAEMKRINREGPPILGALPHPKRLPAGDLAKVIESGATVIDTRSTASFAAGHAAGTINVPLNSSFTTRAGMFASYDSDLYLIVDEARGEAAVHQAARDLAMIGLDRLAGHFGAAALSTVENTGGRVATVPQMTVEELASRVAAGELESGSLAVVDVRGHAEWEEGHIAGVPNIALGSLPERLAELPRDVPLVLHCQGGGRSSVAASVLQAAGFSNVVNLAGGIRAWQEAGQAVEKGADEEAPTG